MSEPLKAGRELDQMVSDVIFGPWDESLCRVCGWKIVPDGIQGGVCAVIRNVRRVVVRKEPLTRRNQ